MYMFSFVIQQLSDYFPNSKIALILYKLTMVTRASGPSHTMKANARIITQEKMPRITQLRHL